MPPKWDPRGLTFAGPNGQESQLSEQEAANLVARSEAEDAERERMGLMPVGFQIPIERYEEAVRDGRMQVPEGWNVADLPYLSELEGLTQKKAQKLGLIRESDPLYRHEHQTGYTRRGYKTPRSTERSRATTAPRGASTMLPGTQQSASEIGDLAEDAGDVDIHGVPLFQRQMIKGLYEAGKHHHNQPYPAYDLKKRFAPNSKKAQDAEALAELANPSNAGNKATESGLASRFKNLADSSSLEKAKHFEDRLKKGPLEEAKSYENKHEQDVIRALKEDHAEALGEQLAHVSSNPLFNRPGLNFSGAKQRALQKTRSSASKQLINVLAKLRHEGFNKAIENQQKQQGIDIGAARGLGMLSNEDLNRKLTSTEKLAEKEEKKLANYYKHAGVKHAFAAKEEDIEQAEKNAEYEQWEEARDWQGMKNQQLANLVHGLPSAGSISHHIKERTPGVYTGPNAMIGQTLAGLATHFLPKESHAQGDSIGQQAMTDSLLDNTDPLTTNRRLIRHQLMSGLLDYRLKKKKQFRKGGAVSPIQSGADSARRYALQERQLAEAERLRQPQGEEHFITKLVASLAPALTNGGKGTAFEGTGRALESGLEDREARNKSQELKRGKSFDIEKDVAKEMNDDMKFAHQMAIEERKAANDEKRLNLLASKEAAKGSSTAKFSGERFKAEERAIAMLKDGIKIKREMDRIDDLGKKLDTGPIIGAVSSVAPSFGSEYLAEELGLGTIDEQQSYKTATDNLILAAHAAMKNIPRTDTFVKRIENSKPSVTKTQRANKSSSNIYKDLASDSLHQGRLLLMQAGRTPEEIAAMEQYLYHTPLHEEEEVKVTETEPAKALATAGRSMTPQEALEKKRAMRHG